MIMRRIVAASAAGLFALALATGPVPVATAATGQITGIGGKCVDVSGANTANGTTVQLWDCNGTGAQRWTVTSTNDITNPQSNKCLDATGSSTANGTRLQIWTCTGAANQKWTAPGGG